LEHPAPTENLMTDFRTADHGSIITIRPLNEAAHQWLDENVDAEPWQWQGGALCVDPRCARDLVPEIAATGFEISP
jgi:hypothetical protein